MNIKPLNDRVVLQPLESQSRTDSGIYIPESSKKEKPFIYEVFAVGPGKKDTPMNVNIGDKVLCGQYSGDEIKHDGKEYKIVAIDYILAVVED